MVHDIAWKCTWMSDDSKLAVSLFDLKFTRSGRNAQGVIVSGVRDHRRLLQSNISSAASSIVTKKARRGEGETQKTHLTFVPRHPRREWSGHVAKFLNSLEHYCVAPFFTFLSLERCLLFCYYTANLRARVETGSVYYDSLLRRTVSSPPSTMGLVGNVIYYAFHPSQLRSILQWLVPSSLRADPRRHIFDLTNRAG